MFPCYGRVTFMLHFYRRRNPTNTWGCPLRHEVTQLLEAAGFWQQTCVDCNCPELEYSGTFSDGVLEVSCPDCGRRDGRVSVQNAIARRCDDLVNALDRNEKDATLLAASLLRVYLGSSALADPCRLVWICSRRGSVSGVSDAIPF